MVLPATSVQETTSLKFLDHIASGAFEWVMQAVSSSALTMEEENRAHRVPRLGLWMMTISVPSFFIVTFAAMARMMYNEPINGACLLLCRLPFFMLPAAYVALIYAAMGHLRLFVPRAPFAAWEALYNGAFQWTVLPSMMINQFVVMYGQAWMVAASACIHALLMAAVVAFWSWVGFGPTASS